VDPGHDGVARAPVLLADDHEVLVRVVEDSGRKCGNELRG
jgi:hypothetical protein